MIWKMKKFSMENNQITMTYLFLVFITIFFRYFDLKNSSVVTTMQRFLKTNYQKNCSPKILQINKSWYLIYFLLITVLFACQETKQNDSRVETLPYYNEATFTPNWLTPNSDTLANFHKIPSFNLTNQNGETITEKNFEDKIYITDFFFTSCPGICPKMTKNMGVLQEAFLDDPEVLLISHSVMPRYDSVAVLKNYAEAKDVIANKWHLVTGDQEHIYNLGRNHYFVEEDLGLEKAPDDFLHTENFVLVDKKRHIRGIYNGLNKTSINQLVADVKTLKKEE